ncbi:MAG: hypothetical protein ACTHK2_18710 [Dokdonella sp.]|uniref:hypothetical protein n=1 Tax=Dokdonella sp. TaxID=2291710 RepID=UPI003F81847C
MFRDYFCAGTTPRYWRLTAVLMLLYLGGIAVAFRFGPGFTSPFARATAALAPVPPVLGFVLLEFRRIRATDELRQRIELEAATSALALGVPLLLALGLLDGAGVLAVRMILASPLLIGIYLLAQLWAHRRYR